ncbi:MAG: hypothetical protein DMG76_15350 [Acidobacteria bacterium]|nr:MAG: hypothetical protein DMG76_15350 [Acidobacteriota bacterium]
MALKRQQEKAFQQMLESYDELDKEITKLESREESILSRMAKQEKKTPGNQESKPLLGRSHSQKLNDLTLEPVAYWRKKLSENKKARRPRLPDILRILEMKRKHPSLGATAIYARLHPTPRKGEWNPTGKRMQEVRQIQKILDWYAK